MPPPQPKASPVPPPKPQPKPQPKPPEASHAANHAATSHAASAASHAATSHAATSHAASHAATSHAASQAASTASHAASSGPVSDSDIELISNDENSDDTARTIVALQNLCDMRTIDLLAWPTFYEDMVKDVEKQCQKFGTIVGVWTNKGARVAAVWLRFETAEEANRCMLGMHERRFAGVVVNASLHAESL